MKKDEVLPFLKNEWGGNVRKRTSPNPTSNIVSCLEGATNQLNKQADKIFYLKLKNEAQDSCEIGVFSLEVEYD